MSRRHRLILLFLLLTLNLALGVACSSPLPWGKSSDDNPVMFNAGVFLGCVTLALSYAWLICGTSLLALGVMVIAVLLLAPKR